MSPEQGVPDEQGPVAPPLAGAETGANDPGEGEGEGLEIVTEAEAGAAGGGGGEEGGEGGRSDEEGGDGNGDGVNDNGGGDGVEVDDIVNCCAGVAAGLESCVELDRVFAECFAAASNTVLCFGGKMVVGSPGTPSMVVVIVTVFTTIFVTVSQTTTRFCKGAAMENEARRPATSVRVLRICGAMAKKKKIKGSRCYQSTRETGFS
jgi:hypothetical protein